jgi:hypothetical protein
MLKRFLLILCLGVFNTSMFAIDNTGFITVPSLRVRSQPDENWAQVVGHLEYGDLVYINRSQIIETMSWHFIQKKSDPLTKGWVRSAYVGHFDKPQSIQNALRRMQREIKENVSRFPEAQNLVKTPDANQKIENWETLWTALGLSLQEKKWTEAFQLLCLNYQKFPDEKTRKILSAMATLIHPTAVVDIISFDKEVCQTKITLDIPNPTDQEQLMMYTHLWKHYRQRH